MSDHHTASQAEVTAYNKGASIRTLATQHGHAYGTQRLRLLMAGVTLRKRGGPRPGRRPPQRHTSQETTT
jgi:hypothetical protein